MVWLGVVAVSQSVLSVATAGVEKGKQFRFWIDLFVYALAEGRRSVQVIDDLVGRWKWGFHSRLKSKITPTLSVVFFNVRFLKCLERCFIF